MIETWYIPGGWSKFEEGWKQVRRNKMEGIGRRTYGSKHTSRVPRLKSLKGLKGLKGLKSLKSLKLYLTLWTSLNINFPGIDFKDNTFSINHNKLIMNNSTLKGECIKFFQEYKLIKLYMIFRNLFWHLFNYFNIHFADSCLRENYFF